MSKIEKVMEENEGADMPVEYEGVKNQGKLAVIKQKNPKVMKALKIGGIGLLAALFGVGCYKFGKKKAAAKEDPYEIDLDELDQNEQ